MHDRRERGVLPPRPGAGARSLAPPPAVLVTLFVLGLLGGGCLPEPASLAGHACGEREACLAGYVCQQGVCVAMDAGDGRDAGVDAGPVDAGPEDAGPGDAGLDAGPGDGGCLPRGEELCNGLDDDCDGVVPDDEKDLDQDHWVACAPWVGDLPEVSGGGDCNDDDPSIHPHALEIPCDGIDSDCDPTDGASEIDGDGDGYVTCTTPAPGSGLLGGDCDDTRANVHPGAVEVCDGRDDDCDGNVDAPLVGYTKPSITLTPSGSVTLTGTQAVTATVSCSALGCPSAHLEELRWYANTVPGVLGTGEALTLVPAGSSDPGVPLATGRHELLAWGRDRCGGIAVGALDVTVGAPEVLSAPGGHADVRAACLGPTADDVWAGTNGGVYTLDAALTVVDTVGGTGALRACAVTGDEGVFGRDSNNEDALGYAIRDDLSGSESTYAVDGSGNVTARAMATDGRGRVWLVSNGRLRVLAQGGSAFVTPTSSRPPDDGLVDCLAYDGADHLWVCTNLGVNRLDVSVDDPTSGDWLWPLSRPIVGEALREPKSDPPTPDRASALAADAHVLWAVTTDTDDRMVRLDLDLGGVDACSGCSLDDALSVVDTSSWQPRPGAGFTDIALFAGGDVLVGTGAALFRFQIDPPGTLDPAPYIWQALGTFDVRDLATFPGTPWTAVAATDKGVWRYRGE